MLLQGSHVLASQAQVQPGGEGHGQHGGVEEDDKIYYLLRHFSPFLEEEKMAKHAVKNEDIMQERLLL